MKKSIFAILLTGVLLSNSSCVVVYFDAGATDAAITANKVGIAKRNVILGLGFGNTNVGLQQAAKNGGITKISTYTTSVRDGLFVDRYKTIVTGE